MQKKVFHYLLISVLLATLAAPIAFAQTENVKNALQRVIGNLETLSQKPPSQKKIVVKEELKKRKDAFRSIIELAFAENADLTNKLIAVENISGDFLAYRDQLLKELANHSNYYQSLLDSLDKEQQLAKVKDLANQFKDWRRIVYHPALKNTLDFLLVFESKTTLAIAQNRLHSIEEDLRRVDDFSVIKQSPLPQLLAQANQTLGEAADVQKAAELVILKSNTSDIQKLIEDSVAKIKDVYGLFLQMSAWLETSSNNNTP